MTQAELLDSVIANASTTTERVERAIEPLDDAAFNKRSKADEWSPAEVIDHLILTNGYYLETMRAAIDSAAAGSADSAVRLSPFGKLLLGAAGPKGNAPAPKQLIPRSAPYSREVVERWKAQQETLASLAEASRRIELSRTKIRNPFIRLFRMNLADCFAILDAHTERHVQQIEARSKVV